MKAYNVIDVKGFMSKLLVQNVFDQFLLSELTMNTFGRFEIIGKLNYEYYTAEEQELLNGRIYLEWAEVKPYIYQLVKGNKTPLSFHISLMLNDKAIEDLIIRTGVMVKSTEVTGLFFHIRYENRELKIITGSGLKIFTTDRSLEYAWDEQVLELLRNQDIAVT